MACFVSGDRRTHFLWQQVDVLLVSALRGVVQLYQGQGLRGRRNRHNKRRNAGTTQVHQATLQRSNQRSEVYLNTMSLLKSVTKFKNLVWQIDKIQHFFIDLLVTICIINLKGQLILLTKENVIFYSSFEIKNVIYSHIA